MATPLDIGLLKNFQIIFPFLFIFAIVYGILSYTKLFGENKNIYALIAAVLAIMSLFSDIVTQTINTAAPWFILLVVFIVFLLLGFMILGAREADFKAVLANPEYSFVNWWIVALVLIIVIGSLSHTIAERKGGYPPYGPGANETAIEEAEEEVAGQESDFWKTVFHPKVLGMLVILLIAFFTVSKLTQKTKV
jgi:hypothetical protein